MNKNVSVWRGFKAPPTNYHVWINEKNEILLHNGSEWEVILDDSNYEDLEKHLAHFPTIHKTDTISTDASDFLDNEFRLCEITQDSTVSNFKPFNRNTSFTVKLGDLHLKGKYPVTNSVPESVNPTLSISEAIGKPVSLVFEIGDTEIGYVDGEIKAAIRNTSPSWIIEGSGNNAFIRNITGGYLFWNGSKYELSSAKITSFSFINENNNCYEIRRNGTSTSLNPQRGNLPGNIIIDYPSGSENNKLHIIDPSLYKLPIISSADVRSNFNEGEGFPYDLLFAKNLDQKAYINCDGADVKVKENTPSKYYLCGSYTNLAIVTNDGFVLDVLNDTIVKTLINSLYQKLFCIVPYGYTSNRSFAICFKTNTNLAFNPHLGIADGKAIKLFDRGANDNGIIFVPYSEVVNKHIPLSGATSSYSGLMSKEDKAKLDGIANNANNYSLPTASSLTKGGVKIGYSQTANNRAVQLSSDKAYVNIPNASTTQSGLLSSSDKSRLDGVNTYKHYYTALSSMDFNLEAWFSVANIQDTESSIIQISTNGHTDVQLAVTTGWESPDDIQQQGGSLTVLNSFMGGANLYFAYVKGVRLRKENNYAKIEVLVNKPNSNDANKVSIVVSILTNAGHNPLVINNNQTTALQYVGTVNENTIVQSFNLEDKAIISKNLVVDNIKLKGYSLEDISKQMHCLQSDPNLDFDASGNDGNCYGYVGTLQNMNISEKSVIIDSISAYVREGVASPNLDTQVWCRLLRYTNNAWEIIYQSTKSKTIKGVLPETLFTFHMEKVSDDYIINNTDRIAVTYVDSETADVLSGVQLGFKTVNKQGGLLNILTNTSAGMSWSPALVFNYLPLSKAAISGSYADLTDKPIIPATVTESTVNGWGFTKVTKITWDASSNMNDFKTPGVYEIYGDRTVKTDNLPITNDGSGNSIAARLTVVASTLQPANNEICITQFLQLSNRIGGEGTTYVRTYNENNNGMNGWSSWLKQMGMVETYMSSDTLTINVDNVPVGLGLNSMIDNGMYSGIYSDGVIEYPGTGAIFDPGSATFIETFVLIVINDYAATGKLGMQRHITQLKYAVDAIPGQSTVKKRVGTDNNGISWGDWTDIGGNTYLNPNDYIEFNYLSKLGVGTFEFSGTLLHDNFPDSIWRYIWDLGIRNNQFTLKVVIDSSTTATATIMGCGKYDIVTFNPSTNSDVVSIIHGSIINALNTEV